MYVKMGVFVVQCDQDKKKLKSVLSPILNLLKSYSKSAANGSSSLLAHREIKLRVNKISEVPFKLPYHQISVPIVMIKSISCQKTMRRSIWSMALQIF
jgi:hypothetical protein